MRTLSVLLSTLAIILTGCSRDGATAPEWTPPWYDQTCIDLITQMTLDLPAHTEHSMGDATPIEFDFDRLLLNSVSITSPIPHFAKLGETGFRHLPPDVIRHDPDRLQRAQPLETIVTLGTRSASSVTFSWQTTPGGVLHAIVNDTLHLIDRDTSVEGIRSLLGRPYFTYSDSCDGFSTLYYEHPAYELAFTHNEARGTLEIAHISIGHHLLAAYHERVNVMGCTNAWPPWAIEGGTNNQVHGRSTLSP